MSGVLTGLCLYITWNTEKASYYRVELVRQEKLTNHLEFTKFNHLLYLHVFENKIFWINLLSVWAYVGPGRKFLPAKTQMSKRPLKIRLSTRFRPLIIVTFIRRLSKKYFICLYTSKFELWLMFITVIVHLLTQSKI